MSQGKGRPGAGALVSLAAVVTVLLLVAAATVAVRSSSGPSTLAFVGGPTSVGRPAAPAAPAAPPGPLSDPKSLDAALLAAGFQLPAGADVYAARVTKTAGGLTYDDYQAGGGALGQDFWPASSLKVLAAAGALEFVGTLGFTGAADVTFSDGGGPRTIQSIYDAAIRDSSNADYDLLVDIAGVDWLNRVFLTPARGFPVTVIQRSYAGGDLSTSPAVTLAEGGRAVTVPARGGTVDDRCDQGNCSNLYEMSESVRRIVLNDEIPEPERFRIARPDVLGIANALRGADGYFSAPVAQVLGPGARVYSKPGYVPDRDCLDVTLIELKGQRLLLAATVPEGGGGCDALVALATGVLRLLSTAKA
jgi:hypothetical protein